MPENGEFILLHLCISKILYKDLGEKTYLSFVYKKHQKDPMTLLRLV